MVAAEDSQHPHGELCLKNLAVLENGKGTSTDPISKALAKLGGDELADELIKLTGFEIKNVLGQDMKHLIGKYGGRPRWALRLFATMDPAGVTSDQRTAVYRHLKSLEGYDLSRLCRKEAQAAFAHWEIKK